MSRRTPITRNNLFYSEDEFQYEMDLVEGYMEEDLNQTVIVYQVDRVKTSTDSLYKENTSNIKYKPPIEVPCLYEIKSSRTDAFNQNKTGIYTVSGNILVYILKRTLKKYNCEIKRGDYLGILTDESKITYFSVTNDGQVNFSNDQAVGAYSYPWRVIEASPVTSEEFSGK